MFFSNMNWMQIQKNKGQVLFFDINALHFKRIEDCLQGFLWRWPLFVIGAGDEENDSIALCSRLGKIVRSCESIWSLEHILIILHKRRRQYFNLSSSSVLRLSPFFIILSRLNNLTRKCIMRSWEKERIWKMKEGHTVWSPRFSMEVSTSSSGSSVFPVTKGPREAMSLSGLPISSIVALGLFVSLIKGEATTWTFPCLSSSNFTSIQGSAHLGWQ